MTNCTIRRLSPDDVGQATCLWRQTRPHDDVEDDSLRQLLANPQYWPDGTLAAEVNGTLIGVIVGLQDGSIPLFFVAPDWVDEPVADELLQRVLHELTEDGVDTAEASTSWRTGLSDCGYDSRYTDILEVFVRNGFVSPWKYEELDVAIEMDLQNFQIPQAIRKTQRDLAERGITFGFCGPELADKHLAFLREHFAGYTPWIKRAEEFVTAGGDPRSRIRALRDGEVVGLTHFTADNFHTTAVREDLRGNGIGTVLYFLALEEMSRRGVKRLRLGEAVYDFYHRSGCRVTRRYMVMRKALTRASKTAGGDA